MSSAGSPDGRAVVEVRDVVLRHGRVLVLDHVDLHLTAGSTTVVDGGNGAGKSSLLRLVAGLDRPSAGTVHRQAARVGFAPERGRLGTGFTVGRYLEAMRRIDVSPAPPAAVDRLVERYRLDGHLARPMTTLSKGTMKKVGLVQALLGDPDLLVLDEPDDGLDDESLAALLDDVSGAARRGAAVVLTSHSRGLTGLDRVLVLERGRLREVTAAAAPQDVEPQDVEPQLVEPQVVARVVLEVDPGLVRLLPGRPERILADRVVYLVPVPQREPLLAAALAAGARVLEVSTIHGGAGHQS